MKHPSFEPSCGICAALAGVDPARPVYEDALWHVRPVDPPHALAGWMVVATQRHVDGPAQFDDAEARAYGPALRYFSRALLRVTGALQIYTATINEPHPHFRVHLVPRYATMPLDASGLGVFVLQQAAQDGRVRADPGAVARVVAAYRDALSAAPAPRG